MRAIFTIGAAALHVANRRVICVVTVKSPFFTCWSAAAAAATTTTTTAAAATTTTAAAAAAAAANGEYGEMGPEQQEAALGRILEGDGLSVLVETLQSNDAGVQVSVEVEVPPNMYR